MKQVFVLGSINMDLVMSCDRMPAAGESRVGHGFQANQGGKGANQAVACAKLGCKCMLIGAVGEDDFGEKLVGSVCSYGVDCTHVRRQKGNSGVCMIVVDEELRDNVLLVDLGANAAVDAEYAAACIRENGRAGDIFIAQLEVNLKAVAAACKCARERGLTVILNPAPAAKIGEEILSYVDLIMPNETETELLTGVAVRTAADVERVFQSFAKYGVKELVITMGARGCAYAREGEACFFPAERSVSVDPTSAGDTFIGAVASRLCLGQSVKEAIPYAAKCAAVTVSRKGAASSIPTAEEVAKIYDLEE